MYVTLFPNTESDIILEFCLVELILIKSAESPTFLNVYREDEQKYQWPSPKYPGPNAQTACKEMLGSDASLPDVSNSDIFNVSVNHEMAFLLDSLDQCPIPINANQFLSIHLNVDQCRIETSVKH